jgi:hypothetical protein
MEDGGDGGEREEMAWPAPGDLQLAAEERPFEIERRFLIEEITKVPATTMFFTSFFVLN